jgi:Tol biopolymer transport system component
MSQPFRRARPVVPAGASILAVLVVVALGALSSSTEASARPGGPAGGQRTAQWVAYQSSLRSGQFGAEGIFLVHPDGTADHEVATALGGDHMHPDWSADGRTLAFRADIGDYPQLYRTAPISDPTGLHARQLTTCSGDCIQVDDPALSPDGGSLAYIEDTGPPVVVGQIEVPAIFELRVARITGNGLSDIRTLVRTRTVTELVEPRWSPDGSRLVYWSDRTDPDTGMVSGTAIFTIRADGSQRRQLTPWSMMAGESDWSPDGTSIVFATHPLILFNFDPVVSNLFTMHPDGEGLRQLTHATSSADRSTQARWTPDGRIIYTRVTSAGRALFVRNADGTQPQAMPPGGRLVRTHGDLEPLPGGPS